MYQIKINSQHHANLNTLADVLVFLNHANHTNVIEVFKNGEVMKVANNGYGKFGIQQPGDVTELFLSMLTEVDIHYIRPLGFVRQPYEMLPHEWAAFTALGSAAYNVFPCFNEEQRRQQCCFVDSKEEEKYGAVEYFMTRHMLTRFGYGHNGPLYGSDRQSNGRHEVHVAYALAEGKTVPFEVMEWYRANPKEVDSIGAWFAVLLESPAYRGKMSAEKLRNMVISLRGDKIDMTNENQFDFIRLMAELPDDASYTQVDDFLYSEGVLKLRETMLSLVPCDLSLAYSPFALLLRERISEWRKQDAIEQAHEQRTKYHHTLRQLHERLKEVEQIPAVEGLRIPNLFAEAIDKKDIDVLLTYLDTSSEHNQITKKAVQEVFGLKVNGLKAAERRNAIFSFCGFDSEQRDQYEKDAADKQTESKHAREAGYARTNAENNKVNFNGEIISAAVYVDRCVADGFTVISTSKKGAATQYWLSNLDSRASRSVQMKDGSLEYAKLVHCLTEYRQAA